MIRLIPTLILVVLCVGGFWYAQSNDFFKEKPEPTVSLAAINKDEVVSYSIKNGDNEIEMQRKDGNWLMVKPSPLPLDKLSVERWVEAFTALSKDTIVEANASDLAPFGLTKPTQQFMVTLQNGAVHTLSIGDPVAIQGFHYAMFSGSPEVFQFSDAQTKPLAMSPIDLMNKKPLKLDYEQVRAVTVDWKGQSWTLTKANADKKSYESDWKLGEQTLKAADATQVIDKLQLLSTEQPAKRTIEVKLDAPELRVEVKLLDTAGKESTESYLGKLQQDTVWLSKVGSEWVYAIPAASIQELAAKGNPSDPRAQTSGQPSAEPPKATQ